MKAKSQADLIRAEILLLEDKQSIEHILLRQQFRTTLDSFKPINVVKNTWQDISSSAEIKNDVLSNLLGLASGYISKKLILGSSSNPLKRAAGTVLQYAIARLVANKGDTIRNKGLEWLNKFLAKEENTKMNTETVK